MYTYTAGKEKERDLDLDLSVFSALLNALINAQSRKGTRDAGQVMCLNSPALARGFESLIESSVIVENHWSINRLIGSKMGSKTTTRQGTKRITMAAEDRKRRDKGN